MSHLELPLVLFTVLTQMAIGLALVSAVRQWAVADGPDANPLAEWGAVAALLGLGIVASFFHLGYPLGAVRMLSNLGTAWLSREILGMIVFGGLVAVTLWLLYRNANAGWPGKLAAAVGLVALFATAMTYAPPSLEAIDNYLPLVFFLLTATILGAAFSSYFTSASKQALAVSILANALVVGLVVYLAAPFVWLSGGTVMRLTGQAYLASPLYWTRLVVGLAFPLLVLWKMKSIPAWLPPILLAGELAGRIIFFTLAVSSAANLGGLY
jgi:DMSO reductase anchor subunit